MATPGGITPSRDVVHAARRRSTFLEGRPLGRPWALWRAPLQIPSDVRCPSSLRFAEASCLPAPRRHSGRARCGTEEAGPMDAEIEESHGVRMALADSLKSANRRQRPLSWGKQKLGYLFRPGPVGSSDCGNGSDARATSSSMGRGTDRQRWGHTCRPAASPGRPQEQVEVVRG